MNSVKERRNCKTNFSESSQVGRPSACQCFAIGCEEKEMPKLEKF